MYGIEIKQIIYVCEEFARFLLAICLDCVKKNGGEFDSEYIVFNVFK